jgi:integrase
MRHRNYGLRKRCECRRKDWPKCRHGWWFNYKWKPGVNGEPKHGWRLSLDRECGKHIDSKSDAIKLAEQLRITIRAGTFRAVPEPIPMTAATLTFHAFAEIWKERRGKDLVSAPIDVYRLKTVEAFTLPGIEPAMTFGEKLLDAITVDDIEAFRDARKANGLSPVSINHDLRLLRKMFNWAVRKGYLQRSPFKVGTEPAITLEREIPRHKRFPSAETEQRLLDAADPLLRAVITAMLDTACRPGEILSLQWGEVSLTRRELTVIAEKEKTRRERVIPISSRLLALLEMRRLDPTGNDWSSEAYVFGDAIGGRVKADLVRQAWKAAAKKAGLVDFQLRDLRHEAGSRFDEAGMPIVYVSTMLGHSNLTTTSRYLNINRRGLHLAMKSYEANRQAVDANDQTDESVAHPLHTNDANALAVVIESDQNDPAKLLPS